MVRFKLDENADPRWAAPLAQAGHKVKSVAQQSLQGADDEVVAEACRQEGLCLITADQDFAQILDYPPEKYAGLIVLRERRPTLAGMQRLVHQIAVAVSQESPVGCLWIVEPGRIRIHQRNKKEL